MKTAIELIQEERQRQIDEEHFSQDSDRKHLFGELAMGAAAYALPYHARLFKADGTPFCWPFGNDRWKPVPSDRKRELIKAGAMIAAEIDRLSALENKQ